MEVSPSKENTSWLSRILFPGTTRVARSGFQRATDVHPFLALHREMNRMFDDVFRGFDVAPFGLASRTLDGLGCPGAGAHASHEHILWNHLAQRAALMAGLLETLA